MQYAAAEGTSSDRQAGSAVPQVGVPAAGLLGGLVIRIRPPFPEFVGGVLPLVARTSCRRFECCRQKEVLEDRTLFCEVHQDHNRLKELELDVNPLPNEEPKLPHGHLPQLTTLTFENYPNGLQLLSDTPSIVSFAPSLLVAKVINCNCEEPVIVVGHPSLQQLYFDGSGNMLVIMSKDLTTLNVEYGYLKVLEVASSKLEVCKLGHNPPTLKYICQEDSILY